MEVDPRSVRFPPVFRIYKKERGNVTRQLAHLELAARGNLATFRADGLQGALFIPEQGDHDRVLVVEKRAKNFGDFKYVIRADLKLTRKKDDVVDLTAAIWMKHPAMNTSSSKTRAWHLEQAKAAFESWAGNFHFVREEPTRETKGLRPPQIGALHAVHSHWTTSAEIATVVMPTGTGKTDTMLSVLLSVPCERVLVVVPTDALRTQIEQKFVTLGVLRRPGWRVVSDSAHFPIVGTLYHKPKTAHDVDEFFESCNVVITTSQIAGQCDELVQRRMAYHCPFLFVDEAHHGEAPTWKSFKEKFARNKVLQFTATPFREDGKALDGKIIYKYPLRKAQEDGLFAPICFSRVREYNLQKADAEIAKRAIEQLRDDAKYNHILMARVDSIRRAEEVFQYYKRYKEFHPVQVHSGVKSKRAREEVRRMIAAGKSRIIVCVDMLGEGFDLPELKIAAFHDIRKSLAVTLQVAGRFTRSRSDLGGATFIANVADVNVRAELRKLYSLDPDWNQLLPELSDDAVEEQIHLKDFIEGFKNFPEQIPLQRIWPAMSTVIYKTDGSAWTPEEFRKGIPGISAFERVHSDVNHQNGTLVIVTAIKARVPWTETSDIYDWVWDLLIVVWDAEQHLLFINSSSNEGLFKPLAQAVAGRSVELIDGNAVFRAFSGVNRLRLQNVGLTEQLGRLIRYTARMGPDVEPGLAEAQKRNTRRSVLSGTGFEKGARVTVGASRKGRIWSMRRAHIDGLAAWCKRIGKKVLDASIDPNEVLRGTLESVALGTLPKVVPFAIDWPEQVYREPETALVLVFDDQEVPLYEADISLAEQGMDDEIRFAITSGQRRVEIGLHIFNTQDGGKDYRFALDGNAALLIRHGSDERSAAEYFHDEPPVIWLVDGASLEGNVLTPLKSKYEPYSREKILDWDWSGVDLRKESQGVSKDRESIQFRTIELLNRDRYDVIFDDDGSGEVADVVAIRIDDTGRQKSIAVELYHCKYSKQAPGRRIGDLFEVCGQAQKSIRWMDNNEKQVELFTHLLRREPKRIAGQEATRFELGDKDILHAIKELSRESPITMKVHIVQPGLSRQNATREQLEILSVTENYLLETYQVPFAVIASA